MNMWNRTPRKKTEVSYCGLRDEDRSVVEEKTVVEEVVEKTGLVTLI